MPADESHTKWVFLTSIGPSREDALKAYHMGMWIAYFTFPLY